MSTTNTLSFYWKAKFTDNFEIAQFNPDGTENIVRDFLTPELLTRLQSNKSIIGKNLFVGLEATHGLITNFGWYPFDHDLANSVRANGEGYLVAELADTATEIVVPADSYPNFYRTSIVEYNTGKQPNKADHELAVGLIKRVDEATHVHATKYDNESNVIEEKLDKTFDRQDKKLGKQKN